MIDFAIIAARFFKGSKAYIMVHSFFTTIILISSTTAEIIAIVQNEKGGRGFGIYSLLDAHYSLGITILVLIVL